MRFLDAGIGRRAGGARAVRRRAGERDDLLARVAARAVRRGDQRHRRGAVPQQPAVRSVELAVQEVAVPGAEHQQRRRARRRRAAARPRAAAGRCALHLEAAGGAAPTRRGRPPSCRARSAGRTGLQHRQGDAEPLAPRGRERDHRLVVVRGRRRRGRRDPAGPAGTPPRRRGTTTTGCGDRAATRMATGASTSSSAAPGRRAAEDDELPGRRGAHQRARGRVARARPRWPRGRRPRCAGRRCRPAR